MAEPAGSPLPAPDAAAARAASVAVRGSGTSAGGAVTVVAGVQGDLDRVSFGAAADALTLDQLGAAIVTAAARARAHAASTAVDDVAPLLGASAQDALRARVPGEPIEVSPAPAERAGLNEEQLVAAPPTPPVPAPRPTARQIADEVEDDAGFSRG